MCSLSPARNYGASSLALLLLVAVAALLAGCGTQAVQRHAREQLSTGQTEAALQTLERGLRDHPNSVELRAALLRTRADALTRLITEAGAARAQSKLDVAESLMQSAQRLDPDNPRVRELLDGLRIERLQNAALAGADAAAAKGQRELALRTITEALKNNPRHAGLAALQRRLEAEQRQHLALAGNLSLAEPRPISLDFRDAALRTVLDLVSRHSGINFVLDKDIRSELRITVYLKSAKVEDALDLIIGTHQLAKKVLDDRTILIYPNTPEKQREYREQVIRVFHLASGEAKQAASFLRSMLKVQEPFVDERSNMIALRESPEVIQIAERLMALYDTSEPEVMLELEVLEVRSSRLTELGIKFPDTIALTPLPPPGSEQLTVGNLRDLNGDRIGVSVSGLLISLRREVGDFEILANPKVRAKNKENAKVLIGSKVPIVTTTSTSTGFVSDSITYLDVGLKLELQPTVYADDDVAIKIGLEVSSLAREVKTSSGGLAYELGTRTASTFLRLRDGETQVLAGLISREERSSASRVPGLGDLPGIGRLFSTQLDNGQRSEVVFAITPHIIRNARQPDASENELWVGTETYMRLRPVGGRATSPQAAAAAPLRAAVKGPDVEAGPATVDRSDSNPGETAALRPVLGLRWKVPAAAKLNEEFDAELVASSSVPVRGVRLKMKPDHTAFAVVQTSEGEWLTRDQSKAGISKSNDDGSGAMEFGVLRHRADGVQGEGVVARIRLRALREGSLELPTVQGQPIAAGEAAPGQGFAPSASIEVTK